MFDPHVGRHVLIPVYFLVWGALAEGAGVAEAFGAVEAAGVTEAAGDAVAEALGGAEGVEAWVAATRTVVPLVRESDGFTITLSDSLTPLRISD